MCVVLAPCHSSWCCGSLGVLGSPQGQVPNAGSVAGNGLWTCGGKHRVVRGAAPGRESQELPAASEAGVKHV